MSYWNFFPAAEGWGHIPVWGFADVVESRSTASRSGERIYGYLPMSTHVAVQPGRASRRARSWTAPSIAVRCPPRTSTTRAARTTSSTSPSREDHHAIFYPLFFTSFMVEDLLSDNDYFGGEQIVIASASSKTALGVAFLLSIKPGHPASSR